MYPFLRDGDVLTISPLPGGHPHFGDVAAYVRPGAERMIVHRVIGGGVSGPVFKGDNVAGPDDPVTFAEVIGRISRVERGGKRPWAVGPERFLIAALSRIGLLPALWWHLRGAYRMMARKTLP